MDKTKIVKNAQSYEQEKEKQNWVGLAPGLGVNPSKHWQQLSNDVYRKRHQSQ